MKIADSTTGEPENKPVSEIHLAAMRAGDAMVREAIDGVLKNGGPLEIPINLRLFSETWKCLGALAAREGVTLAEAVDMAAERGSGIIHDESVEELQADLLAGGGAA